MKIRSITYFCNPQYPLDEKVIQQAGTFLAKAKSAYEAAGYEVQTRRLATIPFPRLLSSNDFSRLKAPDPTGVLSKVATIDKLDELPKLAEELARILQQAEVAYASLGPALPELPHSYEVIPEAIAAAPSIFFGGVMADRTHGIDLAAVRACADVIVKCAPMEPNGFANLQFAALANVGAGAPFFPAAYHNANEPAFAIATESADLAVEAFQNEKTLEAGRTALISEVTKHGQAIAQIAQSLIPNSQFTGSRSTLSQSPKFTGIDFSLAPSPDDQLSLGNAVEQMGVPRIGLHGSLAAAAILTEAIDRADFPHTGFSGFMQPILEDSVLARRAAEGTLTVKDALLYSAVCGTGLDTIPLPGDTTSEELVPLLLDLCALALRLDKPLTARLMPIPNKKAGDETNFDFAFFAPSRVMALDSEGLMNSFSGTKIFHLLSQKQVR
ncbi:MAG TPA: DUF711 family protein [Anaerolineales bacterium]|nr:DUF711 family protein [Anaerolineales bacterium]